LGINNSVLIQWLIMKPVHTTYNLPLAYTTYYACCFGSLGGDGGSNPTIQKDRMNIDKTKSSLRLISTQYGATSIVGCFVVTIGY